MAEDGAESNGARKKLKNKSVALGHVGHASPRINRRSRRRLEQDMMRDERDFGVGEDMLKPRKKRHSGRSKKDKLCLVPSTPSPSMPKIGLKFRSQFLIS